MKKSYITVTDQFCGAGGSSVGATKAGAELILALNHWDKAIETHNSNFPSALHDCTDISACDPRRYPSTDILLTSPECTNHSLAKGVKRKGQMQPDLFGEYKIDPAEERSRATMWDVPRFAEIHNYNVIIVENVVDARNWRLYDAWLHAMKLLGYEHKSLYFNSMHAWPTPQSRDRMYIVFWKSGNRAPDLDFRPSAHCAHCAKDVNAVQSWKNGRRWGKYKQQYIYCCPACSRQVEPYYYCAANAIDWNLPAPRIGDRSKPLSAKTLQRIQAGLKKFGGKAMSVELAYSHAQNNRCHPLDDPGVTQTTRQTVGLCVPPFIVNFHNNMDATSIESPLGTICTSGKHHGLLMPPFYGTDGASEVSDAVPTVTTVDRCGLVMPAWIMANYSPGWMRPISNPLGTVTTADHHSLVTSPFVVSYYTRPSGIGAAIASVEEALPTQPTWPVHYLATPGEAPSIEDCGFRMLQPHEIQAAMAFPVDYKVLGTQREKVKQLGNAVTPPVMEMIFRRCIETLM